MTKSGQKFVARNRAPRVQIAYDVELYGAEKSVQLPFVMGVMSDLSGKSAQPLPSVADRKFLEIDSDNFDDRMQAIAPRAAFSVPNTLTGEGSLSVDLTFERMEDFSPAAVAKKVEPLRKLLDARTQLAHLTTYMDGKTGAEDLIAKLISAPSSFAAIAGVSTAGKDASDQNDLLGKLRAMDIPEANVDDTSEATLNQLREIATGTVPADDIPEVLTDDAETADAQELTEVEDTGVDLSSYDLLSDNDEPTDDEDSLNDLLADNGDSAEIIGEPELDNLFSDDNDSVDETIILEPFGTMSAEKPDDTAEPSTKFRIAIMGDFSGRASRGEMEIGAGLANRKPIKFDIDNLDGVISRFATTLVLPIGNDGAGVEIKLNELDDLHPDELYENVAIFEELSALRQRVTMGDGAKAIAEMQGWAGEFGDLKLTSNKRAKGNAVPADRKLSMFQTLIGDMQGQLATPSPASELIGRIVGPYVQAAPDPAQASMLAVIDEALSGAMRAILHHPDFQAVESTWRSLELLARRVQTGVGLDVVLYDVSAEEWAADLSAQDDLAESGLFQMLGEEPRLDEGQGPLSAVFGLYTLEETPPHAELLARMSKISNWMNAPFMTAISPKFLETKKEDRHPLVAKTWDTVRTLPETKYIGLAAPRFLLRLPYGKKTEPVDPFDFEEFNMRSGLKGMLWANPVVLSAILMAETVNQKGKEMQLGDVMSIDDMPFHYMTDQYGDQIALPCTERLINTRTNADVVIRGYIPLLSMKGQNVVRQGSFQALGSADLAGPWGQSAGAGSGGFKQTTDVSLNSALEAEEEPAVTPQDGDEESDEFDGIDDGDDLTDFGLDDDDDDDELAPDLAALLEGL